MGAAFSPPKLVYSSGDHGPDGREGLGRGSCFCCMARAVAGAWRGKRKEEEEPDETPGGQDLRSHAPGPPLRRSFAAPADRASSPAMLLPLFTGEWTGGGRRHRRRGAASPGPYRLRRSDDLRGRRGRAAAAPGIGGISRHDAHGDAKSSRLRYRQQHRGR